MDKKQLIMIIDLSGSKISAVAAEVLDDNSVNIIAEESKPAKEIRRGKIAQPEETAFSIKELITKIKNRNGVGEISSIYFSINSKNEPADLREDLEACFSLTKLPQNLPPYLPAAIESAAAAVLDEGDDRKGCALIHFGHSLTTLAIYAGGKLQQTLAVPFGGQIITNDIINELNISEANAEKLKRLKGSALCNMLEKVEIIKMPSLDVENPEAQIRTDYLAEIIEARLEEICKPIFDAIEDSEYKLDAGIVITGGASKLRNIVEFISEKTGFEEVRRGDHSAWLGEGVDVRFYDPSYSQLIGAIVLVDEYRKKNPGGGNRKKGKLLDKLKDKVNTLFDDEL
ncbi:MAG: rod shape-determining protein [Prevotellaceae bacterium]|nr:rod shape-determining protein [Prevotellaceae bacterium]